MSNPALLSSIKSAIYRLIDQMKFLPNSGSIYSPDSNFNSTSLYPTLSPVSNIIYTGSNYSPVSVNFRSLQFSNDSIGSSNSPASSFTNSSPVLTTRNIKRKQRAQTWRANHAQHKSRSVRPTTNIWLMLILKSSKYRNALFRTVLHSKFLKLAFHLNRKSCILQLFYFRPFFYLLQNI